MTSHRQPRHPISWERLLGAAMLIVGVVFGYLYYEQGQDQRQYIECQTEVNEEFLRALTLRVEASAREESAQRDLLTATAGDETPERFEAARQQYLRTLDELNQVRRENPLPSVRQCR